ncbi:MAG TPA: DUF4397 domain-containing protein [Casimicrobiaceae bacterium]|nr:DUF4397 domain-containing protein [Casimicrobiaceae bacterium]
MSLRRKLLLVIPLALALLAAGCKVNTINYFPPHPATVRVLNLMVDAPGVDVSVNGSPAFSNVAFQSATAYQSFNNTQTTFTATLSGTTTTLGSFSIPLAGEQPYTLLVLGTTSYPQVTLVSEVAQAPTNGNIQLAVYNAAVNNSLVDIYVTTPGTDITTVGPNYSAVSYGGTTYNLAFPPGTYQVQVTTQGTKTVIYDSGGTVLTPNVALTLFLFSEGSGTLVDGMVLQSEGPVAPLNSIFARMKAANGAPVVGPVNQLISSLQVNLNVNFGSASTYSQIPRGPTVINYEASANPGATIASTNVTVPTAVDTSSFIVGNPGSQQAYMLVDLNIPPVAGNARVRFVNASPGANPVNAAMNGTQLASNVAFPMASPYAQLAATTVTVDFTDAVTGAVLAEQTGVVLTANTTGTIYLIGPPGAQGLIITQDNP